MVVLYIIMGFYAVFHYEYSQISRISILLYTGIFNYLKKKKKTIILIILCKKSKLCEEVHL